MGIVTFFLIVSSLQDAYAVTCSEPQLSMCDCEGTVIDCISRGLDAIPNNIPSDTTALNLAGNSITAIDANSLSGLTSLVSLNLNRNSISNIEADAFIDILSLKLIFLESNMLTTVSANIFGTTTNIKLLVLTNNPLECCTMINLFEWASNQTDEFNMAGSCVDFNTTTEFRQFNSSNCSFPVDGQWGSWSKPTCSVTCGNGIGSRHRTCDSPEPSEDGKDCVGPRIETSLCNL
ncbi:unnamed protein product [Mytilus coruscus]|uniref:LRRNT domain-containing protein n=1 Tax=Mytilus coruscus TaxID=42192 RepID=A0A6J8A0U5_MYTCO|nr:unnamed protein product [Mytilus coruscus]